MTITLNIDDKIADKAIAYLNEFVSQEKSASFEVDYELSDYQNSKEFLSTKEGLQKKIDKYKKSGSSSLSTIDNDFFDDVESKLVQRHKKAV